MHEHSCVFVLVICNVRYSVCNYEVILHFLGDGPFCLPINYGVCFPTPKPLPKASQYIYCIVHDLERVS